MLPKSLASSSQSSARGPQSLKSGGTVVRTLFHLLCDGFEPCDLILKRKATVAGAENLQMANHDLALRSRCVRINARLCEGVARVDQSLGYPRYHPDYISVMTIA
jgi:hypothetical protein